MVAGRRTFSSTQKRELYFRAGGRCSICRVKLGPSWHADHVEPYSAGGETTVDNGQALCGPCNLRKRGKTGALSLPGRDGGWWCTRQPERQRCRMCRSSFEEVVMILPYVARLDPFGFEAKHHQGWAPTNWLRLIDCPACGDHRYRVIIGDVIIAELGHRLGGWEKDG